MHGGHGSHGVPKTQQPPRRWAVLRGRAVSRRGGSYLSVYANPLLLIACRHVSRAGCTDTGDARILSLRTPQVEPVTSVDQHRQPTATLQRNRIPALFSDIHAFAGKDRALKVCRSRHGGMNVISNIPRLFLMS